MFSEARHCRSSEKVKIAVRNWLCQQPPNAYIREIHALFESEIQLRFNMVVTTLRDSNVLLHVDT